MVTTLPKRIGSSIRKIRLSQRRTQEDVAGSAGFTKSLLSKIESGKVTPPVATLIGIASALGTTLSTLVEEKNHRGVVTGTAEEVKQGLSLTEQGYWLYPFASRHQGKKMQPMFIVANRGEVKEHHFKHEGEEFIYLLEGAMWVEVGQERHRLAAGGSIYFESHDPHQIIPITKIVKYLNIFL